MKFEASNPPMFPQITLENPPGYLNCFINVILQTLLNLESLGPQLVKFSTEKLPNCRKEQRFISELQV